MLTGLLFALGAMLLNSAAGLLHSDVTRSPPGCSTATRCGHGIASRSAPARAGSCWWPLVAAGIGCTLLPRSFIDLGRHGVRFVPLRPPLPHRPLALAWRSDHRSSTLEQFLLVARRAVDAYVADLRIRHPALAST